MMFDSVEIYLNLVFMENSNGQEIPFTPFCVPQNGLLQKTTLSCMTYIWLMDNLIYL